MKKLLAMLLVLALLLPAALAEGSRVHDDAQLFTSEEIQTMDSLIEHIRQCYQMDVGVLTTRDTPVTTEDSALVDYADRYYEDNGYGLGDDRSGMLVMIDMNNSYVYISTAGSAIDCLTDARIDAIMDMIFDCMGEGFGKGVLAGLYTASIYFELGVPDGAYRYTTIEQ